MTHAQSSNEYGRLYRIARVEGKDVGERSDKVAHDIFRGVLWLDPVLPK